MTEKNIVNTDFNSTNFFLFLWNWRKTLIIVVVATAIVSGAASFLITPKFKSNVILFPTATNSISRALLAENNSNQEDVLGFGEEEEAEQLLQILNSSTIRNRIVERFNLLQHYKINPNDRYKNTKLIKEYNGNVTCKLTEFMAVEISVLDKDPQYAANMANSISDLLDSTKNALQKERAIKGFHIVETTFNNFKREMKVLEDSLFLIRSKGINDYETESEMLHQELGIQLGKGNAQGIKRVEDKLRVLSEYGGAYVRLRDELANRNGRLGTMQAKYDEAKVDAEQYIPQKFVVDAAFKAEKKTTPVRWLIVVVSSFAAFLLSILVLIFIENVYKKNLLNTKIQS